MIFSELYGAYYNAVAAILAEAAAHPVSDENMESLIKKHAFSESVWTISDAIKGRWQLVKPDGSTPINHEPTMPLTVLQRRWLKAIACDPRIKLFGSSLLDDPDVEPLFLPTDYLVFDKYADGDDYTDETYISNFRLILDAIRKKYPLQIETLNRNGRQIRRVVLPDYLEYSEKDDKFRLICVGNKLGSTFNLGRIISCKRTGEAFKAMPQKRNPVRPRSVVFELQDERDALERVLLHFAHFQKTAERIEKNRYVVTIYYDKEDETEMVIRILSFGPVIKVTAPEHFINLIKQRLWKQKKL